MHRFSIIILLFVLCMPLEAVAWFRLPRALNDGVPRYTQQIRSRTSRRSIRRSARISRKSIIRSRRKFYYALPKAQTSSVSTVTKPKAPKTVDTLSDTKVSSSLFLLLGKTSPIIGAARVVPVSEPLNVSEITVTLNQPTSSIDAFLMYKTTSEFLGYAYLDTTTTGGKTYTLFLKTSELILPKSETFRFYVRTRTRTFRNGGLSGQEFSIDSLTVKGDGVWSHNAYTKATTETFPTFETARSHIVSIERTSSVEQSLLSGLGQYLGSFRFKGTLADNGSQLRVNDIAFQINQSGGVTLANVKLRRVGAGAKVSCTVGSNIVTCASIPNTIGTFRSGPAEFRLYGDISVPSTSKYASLQMVINDPGTPTSAGAVTWTDGESTFDWMQLEQPVVGGTLFKY